MRVDTLLPDRELTRLLAEAGVKIRALSEYYHDRAEDQHCLVMNYSGLKEENLQKALEKIGNIM